MSEREPHPHFPPVPELYVRPPDLVPGTSPPPVDAGGQGVASAEGQSIGQQRVEVFGQTPVASLPALMESAPPAPTGEATADAEPRERERVQLVGRLGQDPRLRTTPKGTLIASFPLGVKDEADLNKTTWHTVLAFQQRAAHVRDSLKKGDPVEVIGYVHERAIPRRDGTSRTVREVYATVIKPR
jgi:primosomal replication protein N